MRQWVEEVVGACDVAFATLPLLSAGDLSSLYRGLGTSQRFPLGRRMRWSLWRKVDGQMLPVGLAAIACWGVLHNQEYGEIRLPDQRLVLARYGSCLKWRRNGTMIGAIHYSRRLRALYHGPATLWRGETLLGTLRMPFIGPSLRQLSDCFGTITLVNGDEIRFLLKPKEAQWIGFCGQNSTSDEFVSHPPLESTPLFQQDVKDKMSQADADQLYLFLGVAMWARMFFTYA